MELQYSWAKKGDEVRASVKKGESTSSGVKIPRATAN
jgi:hypothetical protein